MTEQELLTQLSEIELHLKDCRLTVSALKEKLTAADTLMIGIKLKRDQLQETLRRFRNASYQPEPDHRAADDARFLTELPELLKKLAK